MRAKNKKRPMAQINVVPYIDVMLVLLIIFMVTAPLITQGIKVDLPVTSAKTLAAENNKPVVITIKASGEIYLNQASSPENPLPESELTQMVAKLHKEKPLLPVLVRADQNATHGMVTKIMALLQAAGIKKLGIVTKAQHVKVHK